MKIAQVARDMMKDPQTITAWIDAPEFLTYFSPEARGKKGQRNISESEYDVINAIREMRNRNVAYEEIARLLETGRRTDEPPPGLATRSTTMPATVYANQIAATRENNELRGLLVERDKEVARLAQELQATTERLMLARSEKEQDLNRTIGRLEARLELLQEQIEEMKQSRK